jgi:hypothetical protein
MLISFSPIRSDETLSLHRDGDILTINGMTFDFSTLPEGTRLPASAIDCPWIANEVIRENNELCLTLILPYGENAPEEVRFPEPITPENGPIIAPGLVEPPETFMPGNIDWFQLIIPEIENAQKRIEWRQTREISKLDLVLRMVSTGLISMQSAITAASGGIPSEFEQIVSSMPEEQQIEARIRWAGASMIPRLSPMILAVQNAAGLTNEQVDVLFGWEN